jgi:3-dehydroquinate synthase
MKVKSSFGDYSVEVLETVEELESRLSKHQFRGALLDSAISEICWKNSDFLAGLAKLEINPSEEAKQYRQLERVYDWMVDTKFDRKAELLAVGGGTVQDIATFVSATFHRGISWTFVPSTLLAQADSCIGGKCGINLQNQKNQVGLVYPPSRIFAPSSFLNSLAKTDLIAGMGEILKIAVTGRDQFWEEYQDLTRNKTVGNLNYARLTALALEAKRYVVEEDEMEMDFRRVLNYGHTLGHALEAASDFSIPHGVAVILGIKAISHLGVYWKLTPETLAREVISAADVLLDQYEGPVDFDVDKTLSALSHDKKTIGGSALFIILRGVGHHEFVSRSIDENLRRYVRAALHEL